MVVLAEYLWLDGAKPTAGMRSKTRIIDNSKKPQMTIMDFPEWNFDGSSTYQAPGDKSDLILKPVSFVLDPIRGQNSYLVLCEVFHVDGHPIVSNTRAILRESLNRGGHSLGMWVGFEQEYTLFYDGRPLGWPKFGFLEPQGPFYCGVGADRTFGRPLVEKHMDLCIEAGLLFCGINAEVMPSQWEFQIGPRGFANETADPLTVCDQTWIARWLLQRVGEEQGVIINFSNKPIKGDWNGAGAHTNFSTKAMRNKETGWSSIERVIDVLKKRHKLHIDGYGDGLYDRLTGKHETCDIHTFRAGVSDRGASIRISPTVVKDRCGYLEDRRPGANCDPYVVSALLLEAAIIAESEMATQIPNMYT
jgi:glutamine synthetase